MIQRCGNKRHKSYPRYGGRGIAVCKEWRSFKRFMEDMGSPPTPEHTIDRLNSDGNYEPGNCIWANRVEQSRNRPGFNREIEFRGRTYVAAELAEIFNIPYSTFLARLDASWSVEEAGWTPVGGRRQERSKRRVTDDQNSRDIWPGDPANRARWEEHYRQRQNRDEGRLHFLLRIASARYNALVAEWSERAEDMPDDVRNQIERLQSLLFAHRAGRILSK